MKKVITLISLIATGLTAQANPKTIMLQIALDSPANNSTINVGSSFTEDFTITILGPDVVAAGDTLLYVDPAAQSQGTAIFRTNMTKNVGDTIHIVNQYTLSGGTNGTISYCIDAIMTNAGLINTDSVYSMCNNVTIAGGTSSGVTQVVKAKSTTNLSFSPNPANGVINIDYTAAGNTSDVVANVYDVTGRLVSSNNFGRNNKSNFKLDVSNLKPGLYIVEMLQDGHRSVGKLNKL